tara:strand:+ start:67 stop:567 length:501 start_codon:yes stop_codon:yes gene_type:complete
MFFNSFISLIFISFSFSVYQVGDQISQYHQSRIFDVCYGMEEHGYFDNCSEYDNKDDCPSYNPEPFDDLNMDGVYTYAEPFEDLNGNGRWDEGEPYEDLNENGSFDSIDEPYDDLYDNNIWDSGFGCEWINNQCREFPVMSLENFNGYINDDGVFYVTMIDMAASW